MAGGLIHYIRIVEARPPGVTVRRWRGIRHGTFRVMGMHWHQHMLPDHFKPNAQQVYHYEFRTKEYEKQKAWFRAKGRGITHEEIVAETIRSMPKGLKANRGFSEDVFWQKFRETRDRMLSEAGDPRSPLVYTGRLREQVLQVATIRTFETRFKLVMPGTPYTPDRPRRPNQPPIAQEVTRLLEREKEVLAKLGKAYAVEQLKAPTETITTDFR